jgi:hypothetical protein
MNPTVPATAPSRHSSSESTTERPYQRATVNLRIQPERLLPDILLEILAWLAYFDWLAHHQPESLKKEENLRKRSNRSYSLIRASQVCRYWRRVALGNRTLWGYMSLEETIYRDYDAIDREFTSRVQRSVGLSTVSACISQTRLLDMALNQIGIFSRASTFVTLNVPKAKTK